MAKKLFLFIVSFGVLFGASETFATLERFNVVLNPSSAQVGQAVDLTIEALDSSGAIVKDFTGEVLIFSMNDNRAELPQLSANSTYSFTPQNQGVVKFENGVKFTTAGVQEIYVGTLTNPERTGRGQVQISAAGASLENVQIRLNSPQNGVTIGTNSVRVAGETQKNHRVKITAGTVEQEVISNNEGIFETNLTGLADGNVSIKASVLNSAGNVVGESENVAIRIDSSVPDMNSITVTPQGVIAPDTFVDIAINATRGLSEVSVNVNDVITMTEERTPGVYVARVRVPGVEGKYPINVNLKGELGNNIAKTNAYTLDIVKAQLTAPTPEPTLPAPEPEKPDYSIKNVKVVTLKSKSVITWDAVTGVSEYEIYKKNDAGNFEFLKKVSENKFEIDIASGDQIKYDYFAIKAIGKDSSGNDIIADLSEATKVQTGPEIILLVILALGISGFFAYSRRKNA